MVMPAASSVLLAFLFDGPTQNPTQNKRQRGLIHIAFCVTAIRVRDQDAAARGSRFRELR
jgi:hypothetical protein